MKMKESTTKLKPTTLMAREQTLRGKYAMNAPDTMPEWYKLKVINPRNNIVSEQTYFEWRFYYADRMIEMEFKK